MQYCLISKCLKSSIPKTLKRISFAKVIQLSGKTHNVLLISSYGQVFVQNLKTNEQCHEANLIFESQRSQFLLEVKQQNGILCLLTATSLYLTNMEDFLGYIETKQTVIQVKKVTIQVSNAKLSYQSWTNTVVKIITFQNQRYMKLAGRTLNQLQYCYCLLDTKLSLTSLFIFDQQIPNEHKISINILESDLLIYPAYINKSKPLKVTHVKFYLYGSNQKGADSSKTEVIINHFFKQLTVLQLFMANSEVLCLIGNNSFEQQTMSVMIVFNVKEKYTLNYLTLNNVRIQRLFVSLKPQYEYHSKQINLLFDAFQVEHAEKHKIRYYQLSPESYRTEEETFIEGNILTADHNFLISKHEGKLNIYPKIHKWTLYQKMLDHYHIDKSLIGVVIDLLK